MGTWKALPELTPIGVIGKPLEGYTSKSKEDDGRTEAFGPGGR
jgi:hypothetical protein